LSREKKEIFLQPENCWAPWPQTGRGVPLIAMGIVLATSEQEVSPGNGRSAITYENITPHGIERGGK
jgi:hypothetical protein